MIIWSILTQQAWEELQREGRLEASVCHVDKDFLAAYTWMVAQMERRLTIPKPSEDTMPIWVWCQWWRTGIDQIFVQADIYQGNSRYQGRVAGRK